MDQSTDLFDNATSRKRFEAFARLQATAVAFGESLPIPEIVAIGGQSDGKSSLMEALLGFRFNICSSEMGTRRPLIIQMSNDPECTEPRCRLQDEEASGVYGPVMSSADVIEAIKARTGALLAKLGASVCAKPIVMRAEYAFCPNLTIIDTPGLILKARNGDDESTPDEILTMVKQFCAPRNRIILFLQQASVEWASSIWLDVVQQVDPSFNRTIMVASKFDNRLKELTHQREVDAYLSASGYLPSGVVPFFVALPKADSQAYKVKSNAEWRRAIQEVDQQILTVLKEEIEGGSFDERRYGQRVGFASLKRHLEKELSMRYHSAAPSTLALLLEKCKALGNELVSMNERLQQAQDVASLRQATIHHVLCLSKRVDDVMSGFGGAQARVYGLTAQEELKMSAESSSESPRSWNRKNSLRGLDMKEHALQNTAHPQAEVRLFGGAAVARCVDGFIAEVQQTTYPGGNLIDIEQAINMVLAQDSRGNEAVAVEVAAEEVVREAVYTHLLPKVEGLCHRLGTILRRSYLIAAEIQSREETKFVNVAIQAATQAAFNDVVCRLEEQGREKMRHHVMAITLGRYSTAILVWNAPINTSNHRLLEENNVQGAFGSPCFFQDENDGNSCEATEQLPCGKDKQGEEEKENEKENRRTRERPSFIPTQMAVPETPSPDTISGVLNDNNGRDTTIKRTWKKPRDALNKSLDGLQTKKKLLSFHGKANDGTERRYQAVCTHAQRLFECIKTSVLAQVPGLKSLFLEPLRLEVARSLCTALLAKTDEDFLKSYFLENGKAVQDMQDARDVLEKRLDAFTQMAHEFGEIARALHNDTTTDTMN
jgi:hypothetical protein